MSLVQDSAASVISLINTYRIKAVQLPHFLGNSVSCRVATHNTVRAALRLVVPRSVNTARQGSQ